MGRLQRLGPSALLPLLPTALVSSEDTYLQPQVSLLPKARRQALLEIFGDRWQLPFFPQPSWSGSPREGGGECMACSARCKWRVRGPLCLLLQIVGRGEALRARAVQRQFRHNPGKKSPLHAWSHPHYWAAWQLSGDSGAVPQGPTVSRSLP
jgi:hypothetical protein